ncbi:hypothetical protein GCM10010409_16990 [Mycolicibacterium diernhoferi]|uniref:Alpha/beta hydrolase n=2 Tax=Mycolicibacterium diernhoferi TaxID=1801 RepID=A0A1Q4HF15_9MYCO|nr:hypothetical protein BRW64_12080 [Mycolicibacterium diernhoferi]OPE55584.1 hypothetical protein BV510_04410 [Mycolicibacterium diernhoferi]
MRSAGSMRRLRCRRCPPRFCRADKPWRTDLLPADATRGEQVTETHSGHDVYLYNPAVVVVAIRDV